MLTKSIPSYFNSSFLSNIGLTLKKYINVSSVILFNLSNLDNLPTLLQQSSAPSTSDCARGLAAYANLPKAETTWLLLKCTWCWTWKPWTEGRQQLPVYPRGIQFTQTQFITYLFFFSFMRFGKKSHKISICESVEFDSLFFPYLSTHPILFCILLAFQILTNRLLM